jgi:protein-tyrosine phosphatase
MIDLHSHLLPGIDDGPPDLEHSVALARAAADQGTRVLAATPHLRADFPAVVPDELPGRCEEVRAAIRDAGIDLEVVQGGEAGVMWAVHAEDHELRAGSYGGRGTDLLIESPYGGLPGMFDQLVESVANRGYRLLLAHPENNPTFQKSPERVRELVDRGVLIQVTARSLIRPDAKKGPRPVAESLVRQGLVHVLASDAHSGRELRPPALGAGMAAAVELVGEARARWMVEDAPAAIVAGEPLPEAPPIVEQRSGGLLARLRRR